ncbi:hypothetical protein CYMTET_17076 [Cymbomonas tetramitiformis]|uniref:PiggyBac transposable element-derived protein domain-containing protein n=1 Tax=Cymbomonas tetramitiformis TaxID=36881 RepID=A0AAE0GAM4_9CHLO|nr:hypothetical protein CYMTET_17076 [Cymbomonas tetramitiformis]
MASIHALDLATGSVGAEFFADPQAILAECGEPCEFDDSQPPADLPDVESMLCHEYEEDSSYVPLEAALAQGDLSNTLATTVAETQSVAPANSQITCDPTSPSIPDPGAEKENSPPPSNPVLGYGETVVREPSATVVPVSQQVDTTVKTAVSAPESLVLQDVVNSSDTERAEDMDPVMESVVEQEDMSLGNDTAGGSSEGAVLPTAVAAPDTVTLISDLDQISKLLVKDLKIQCKLRKLAQTGNKHELCAKLHNHIRANPSFTTPAIVFDPSGARVLTQPTPPPSSSTTVPSSVVAPTATAVTPLWVELTVEQAKNLRLRRPEWSGDESGGPSQKLKHLTSKSHPIEFFDMFISPEFRHEVLKNNTNMNAAAKGAGGEHYPKWTPATPAEIDKFIGLLMRNGLAPVPDIRLNWTNPRDDFVYGDERVHGIFARGVHGYKELKAFFHVASPIVEPPKNKPFFKVQNIVDHLVENSKLNWLPGRHLSKDEIDIGFQGRCALKDKIKYKDEGDGFLADCIADHGYMFTCHFRHDPCPTVETNASPLHNRCLYLAEQVSTDWNTIWFDNLFTSKKFLQWLYSRKKLGCGVCRASGRGLPACVVQDVVTRKAELEATVGTIKVARSFDFTTLAFSIYDSKPVHLMSTHHSAIKVIPKTRKVWDAKESRCNDLAYTRLNAIDDYNHHMNGVDICDQLRNQYRMDGAWNRERKWWFPIFKWAVETACSNAFKCYKKIGEREQSTELLSHRSFLSLIAQRLCGADQALALREFNRRKSMSSVGSCGSASVPKQSEPTVRAPRLTPNTVTKWVSRFIGKHPMKEVVKDTHCQVCKYQSKFGSVDTQVTGAKRKDPDGEGNDEEDCDSKVTHASFGCQTCGIWFCGVKCWNAWHGL